jgi:hypothetical protein
MSNIITYLKCKHCHAEFYPYISFGENTECFNYKWICEKCNSENIRPVHSFWGLYPYCCKSKEEAEQIVKKYNEQHPEEIQWKELFFKSQKIWYKPWTWFK